MVAKKSQLVPNFPLLSVTPSQLVACGAHPLPTYLSMYAGYAFGTYTCHDQAACVLSEVEILKSHDQAAASNHHPISLLA